MTIKTDCGNHGIAEGRASSHSSSASVRTLDDITAQLTQIWQDMLGVRPIAPDQNYFDLGGDSILAVQLFIEIEQEFDVKLPLATLFDAPTVGELAQVLLQESAVSGWLPLVTIQPSGTRPPFFCMHGAGGNVLIYRDLARLLGTDQPFYGLQAQGLDGRCPPLTRIEEMAALYVKHIRKVCPRGPYFLGGYCMGGTIAFEVAQQLRSAGEQVALLALFDTMDWSKIPRPTFWTKGYRALQRLAFHTANFFHMDARGRTKFFTDKASPLRWRGMFLGRYDTPSLPGISNSVLEQLWGANEVALKKYMPKPYDGLVTDFRPFKQYTMYDRPNAKWDQLALGGQEVVVLPAYPAGMLLTPFVERLAVELSECIDRAMRRRAAI